MDVLTPELVIHAYRQGLFPMADSRHGRVGWYFADPRAILPLDGFRMSRSLRRRWARGDYALSIDTAFEEVIRACAKPGPQRAETWINDQIIDVYTQLHHQGVAHSVEARDDAGRLVGGLYGLAMGRAFFGESMFSLATDASKVCLVHLVHHLRRRGFTLLDAQIANDHMRQFGLVEIPGQAYLQRLAEALCVPEDDAASGQDDSDHAALGRQFSVE